jgi:hypothetical protein
MPQFLLKMPSTSSWSQLPFYTASRKLNIHAIEELERIDLPVAACS